MILFVSVILVALLLLAISIVVLSTAKNKSINKTFFYLCLLIVFWIIANHYADFAKDVSMVLFWNRLTIAAGSLWGLMLIRFFLFFPKKIENKIFYYFFWIYLVPSLFFVYLTLTSNFIIQDIMAYDGGYNLVTGSLDLLNNIWSIIGAIFALILITYQYKKSKGYEKIQIQYFIFGAIFFFIIGLGFGVVWPLITKSYAMAKYSFIGVVFLIISTAYSIISKHLFDIRIIIKKTIIYSVLLVFVLATYALIIFIFASLLGMGGTQITIKTIAPNLIAAIFIAAGFEPLRKWLTVHTDKFLFKGEYRPQDVLNKLSKVLSSVLDLDEALISIINVLVSEIRLERAAAFVLTSDPETKKIVVKRAKSVGYGEEKITLEASGHLINYFEKYIQKNAKINSPAGGQNAKPLDDQKQDNQQEILTGAKPLITEEIKREMDISGFTDELSQHTVDELSRLKAEVALPIIVKGNLIGIFLLGAKKSGDIFSDNDLDLLTTVANQTAAAIEKARFYEEDQLKSEFVSIASHELLTPTSAIEGYLSMILDEGMGRVDEQARKYLTNVYASSKRLAGLVKDLLNVSRIEGGRIIIQSKNFDIRGMIKEVITEMQPKAKEKNLQLVIEGIDRKMPQVWADSERVHQVLINLIGNAIKYTGKGKVTVRADFSLSVVRVSVIDTGVGIPKDEVSHLFEKFYRASNADTFGAQGTGLGLYITKQIVELMGGIIQVDSELGKGSAFSFSLPKAKETEK